MPIYLKTIGFSVVLIGVLEGFAEATAGLSKGYFGNLSDRRGHRLPFVKWGYLLSAISKPMLAAFTYPLWIFFARTTDRLGKGIRIGARDAMLSDESSAANKGKVFGFHRALDTAGAAIGPLIALLFLAFFPGQYKWLFIIAFAPGVIAIAFTFLIKEKRREPSTKAVQVGFLSYFGYWKKSSRHYKQLVSGLLAFTLFNSSDVFLLLALKYQGLSDTQMIGVYIFYNLIYALLSYPVGMIADRLGLKRILVAGLLIFAGVYTSMGFADSLWQFVIIFSFYALYAAATEGISKALISNIASKSDTATAIGFFTSFASIFTLLASSLAGLLWHNFGPKAMFLVSGAGVGCVVIYFAAMKYKEGKNVL